MSKNDIRRLKNEADIHTVVNALGIPITKKGSAYFIPCPNPSHDDKNATNCYFKDGWNNVYCKACGASIMAIDLIIYTTQYDYGDAADWLWELEGKPPWYHTRGKKRRELFDLTREESQFLGIHYPSAVLAPVRMHESKTSLDNKHSYNSKCIDGYLECKTESFTWRDFMTETEFASLVSRKAKEKANFYVGLKNLMRSIFVELEKTGQTCKTNEIFYQASEVGEKNVYLFTQRLKRQYLIEVRQNKEGCDFTVSNRNLEQTIQSIMEGLQ